jgi:adenine-specific DNA-methyltransferase
MKLYETLEQQLKKEPNFVKDNGELKKRVVLNKAQNFDVDLIGLLLDNPELKSKFFISIKDALIFNQNLFMQFLEQKNYLNDSYTLYKNKVGLTIDGEYLKQRNEVALVWPFKDCILEGGQSREEDKRAEIFFNEILAQDEITQLLEPKVLTNAKRIDKDGEKPLDQFNRDENGTITDNLIIKGNNLLALHSLKAEFAGKVKLIYIDPPYYFSENKATDTFAYNSNFKLSTWLSFMKNRLEIAKVLLDKKGVIFVQIDDDGQAYLKVLMDEVFSGGYLNSIIVKAKATSGASGGGEDKKLKKNTEYIHIYKKSDDFERFNDQYDKVELMQYIQELKDDEKAFSYTQVLIDEGKKEYYKSTVDGRKEEIKIYKHTNYIIKSVAQLQKEENLTLEEVYNKYIEKIFTTENAQTSIRDRVLEATDKENTFYTIEYVPISGKNKGQITHVSFIGNTKRLVSYIKNSCVFENNKIYKLLKLGTLWDDMSWSSVFIEGGVKLKNGKKPEQLLKRIIELTTNENDIVLDYHLGSGTTCAVAHKLNRQYIGLEQLNYDDNDSVVRLRNVINGDLSGISKSVNWQGGGSFIYLELKKYNQAFIEQIQATKDPETLLQIWEQMKTKSFLNYNVDVKKQNQHFDEFKALSLSDQKQLLCELLDKNQLYVNLSSLGDADFACTEEEKNVTRNFYQRK